MSNISLNEPSYLSLLTNEMLWKDMEDAAEVEDYKIGIYYRDELIKRGLLKGSEPYSKFGTL
ncbi:MAG: hypothetical protein V4615_01850 [Bacteroidota bacterium]